MTKLHPMFVSILAPYAPKPSPPIDAVAWPIPCQECSGEGHVTVLGIARFDYDENQPEWEATCGDCDGSGEQDEGLCWVCEDDLHRGTPTYTYDDRLYCALCTEVVRRAREGVQS